MLGLNVKAPEVAKLVVVVILSAEHIELVVEASHIEAVAGLGQLLRLALEVLTGQALAVPRELADLVHSGAAHESSESHKAIAINWADGVVITRLTRVVKL